MTTFSQLVDDLCLEMVRPDLRLTIADAVSTTIRELHTDPNTGKVILYKENLNEDELTVAVEPFLWPIPAPARFQRVDLVYYQTRGIWVDEKSPRLQSNDERFIPNRDAFWYRGGGSVIFSGAGIGEVVKLSWYEYPRKLVYYPANNAQVIRPANYDPATEEFTYADSFNSTPELQEQARNLTSHWLLLRWDMAIRQGVRAKIWSRLGESDRARIAYSSYQDVRAQLHHSEEVNEGVRP